jgi:hypothetical protein
LFHLLFPTYFELNVEGEANLDGTMAEGWGVAWQHVSERL